MKRILFPIIAVTIALFLASCTSEPEPVTDTFVGTWESTGGERISMNVGAPGDGVYPIRITGDSGRVDLSLSARQSGENTYTAEPDTGSTWIFRLVDEDLVTATAQPTTGQAATTSFKRVTE